jgi:two-component system, NarL family, invasion response regulator UvrY
MKILIADDHAVVREGLKQIIRKVIANSVLEEAVNGDETLDKIEKNEYNLVILDISMPGKSGLDILQELKDKKEKTNILILSIHPQEQYAIRALKSGASGYICKDSVYEELAIAIKTILAGKRYISPALAEKIVFDTKDGLNKPPHEKLSEREFQIMCKLAKGKSVKEIAGELFISDKTVSTYRMRLLEKMSMKNNAELINYAIKNNLIE